MTIYPGRSPEDYYWKLRLTSSASRVGTTSALYARATIEMWVQPDVNPIPSNLPANGWFVTIENIDHGDGTFGGGITIWYAGSIVDSVAYSTWHPDVTVEIYLRDAAETVHECDGWDLEASKFEVYADGVLIFTRTIELSKAGDSWDPRANQSRITLDCGTLTPPIVLYPPYAPAHSWDVTATASGGWTHGGTEETIDIDGTFAPPDLHCPCAVALPSIGATGCEHVTLSAESSLTATLSDRGLITCDKCPDGQEATIPAIFHVYDATWDYRGLPAGGIYCTIGARNDGIKTIRKVGAARCSSTGDPEEPFTFHGPEDDTLDHTQAEISKGIHRLYATKTYAFLVQKGECPGTGGGGGAQPFDVVPCVEDHTNLCVYDAYVHQNWPFVPVCGSDDTIGAVHLHRDVTGLDYAVISFDTHVDLWRFNYDGDQDTEIIVPVSLGFTAIAGAQAGWHSEGHEVCVFVDSGTIWRTTNYGKGDTGIWSEPVTVTPGDALAFAIDLKGNAEYVAAYKTIGGDTGWFLYRMLDGEAGFTLIGLIVVTGTVLFAGLEVDGSSANRLIFVYNDSGTIYRLYSMDFGDIWN